MANIRQSGKFSVGRFIAEQRLPLPFPKTSLKGLTILVTGCNTGLGLETARHFVRLGADTLIMGVRTVKKGEAARDDILASVPGSTTNIQVLPLDQTKFQSVKDFADTVIAQFPAIHIAVLNAGINHTEWKITPDGWEELLQVNVISTAYLSLLLLPKIAASATNPEGEGEAKVKPHLTIVSSDVHYTASFPQQKDAFVKGVGILGAMNDKAKTAGFDKYQASKLMNIYWTRELAAWVEKQSESSGLKGKVIINTVNPGLCKSELGRDFNFVLRMVGTVIMKIIARETEVGSRNFVWAAVDAGVESQGRYIGSCEVQKEADLVLSDNGQKLAAKLYEEIGEVLVAFDGSVKTYFN